jgi:2-polyprenyl-6-methoxyphenol hydroxylase-like FAD-dependent oxidoreductase
VPANLPPLVLPAGRYVRPRVALVGDAAHSGHPFGLASQGVNLGFGDAKVLAAAIADAVATGQDIGSAAMLERQYERPRRQACSAMLSAADALRAIYMPQASKERRKGRRACVCPSCQHCWLNTCCCCRQGC